MGQKRLGPCGGETTISKTGIIRMTLWFHASGKVQCTCLPGCSRLVSSALGVIAQARRPLSFLPRSENVPQRLRNVRSRSQTGLGATVTAVLSIPPALQLFISFSMESKTCAFLSRTAPELWRRSPARSRDVAEAYGHVAEACGYVGERFERGAEASKRLRPGWKSAVEASQSAPEGSHRARQAFESGSEASRNVAEPSATSPEPSAMFPEPSATCPEPSAALS